MKKVFWVILILLISFSSCSNNEEEPFIRFVPDGTPLIVGLLENSMDTVHHYPEVFVGTVRSEAGIEIEYTRVVEGVWWPIVSAQVAGSCTYMDLMCESDNLAKVLVKGPLNMPGEQAVIFTSEGHGVYGDQDYELDILPGARYELEVELSDGRLYRTPTQVPRDFEWEVPDSVFIEVQYEFNYNGNLFEDGKELYKIPFSSNPEVGYVIYAINSEFDYEYLGVPREYLLFADRGPYLREGTSYGIFDADTYPDMLYSEIIWSEGAHTPIKNSNRHWLRVYEFNEELSNYLYLPFIKYAVPNDKKRPFNQRSIAQSNAFGARDTTYLFEISNILKVSPEGEVLPKSQTDAIGVFGAYTAGYQRTTVIPIRDWDPDSLGWGNH